MRNIDTAATGMNIWNMRTQRGISVRQIQDRCGFSGPNAVYKWQNGECLPTVANLVVLSEMFGVKMDDIIVVR